MFIKILKINFAIIFLVSTCFATIVKDTNIMGNKRLSKESIILFGKVEIGKDYNSNDLNTILKSLYETNFFEKINLKVVDGVLNIDVIENPIIDSLTINGIKSSKLNEALIESMQLKSRKSYNKTIFLEDLNLLKNMIKSSGYYFADIQTSVIRNEKLNSIKLVYDIDLGDKAKINEIIFLGDKKIKDRKLKNVIVSEEHKFWKLISNKTFLEAKRIDLDTRLLTNYYKNKGYYNAKIENSFVEYKSNGSFKLIFNINSGNKFTFNNLNLVIPSDYNQKYFKDINKSLKKLNNKTYSLNKVNKLLKEVDKIALSKQYEFIDANLTEKIVGDNKLDFTITLKDTEKFYVETINILGNQYTLEEVIRNAFIVDEGDPYNEILFNKSINNLRGKNIFGFVKSNVKDGSRPNLKIIDIEVAEKPTGEISLGAGIGTSGGTIGGGIRENNFLGKGISLDTNLTVSKNTVKGGFTYAKPNFNNSENTLFTSLSSTTEDRLSDFGYKSSNLGFSVGTKFEQYEDLFFRPEIEAGLEKIETSNTASKALKKQDGDYVDIYFNYSLDYDLRDQKYRASEGTRAVFYQTLPIASENYEIANSIEYTVYQKLVSDMVGKVSVFSKAINTLSNKDVRLSKRLYLPANKLRGFEAGKVGPVDSGDFIGGNYISSINISSTVPQALPSFQNTDILLFFDAANVWGVDYNTKVDKGSKIRSAAGIGLDVVTPIGPLNFSLSRAITKKASDKTESFRFNLGTTF